MGDRQHYSNNTLIGNWSESRLDTSTASRPEFERTGQHRTPPLKMPQFTQQPEMYVSTQKSAYIPPREHKSHARHPVPASYEQAQSMPNVIAAHEHAELTRPDAQPNPPIALHGFGGILPRHDPLQVEQRVLTTTTHTAYGGRDDAHREFHAQQTQTLHSPLAQSQRAAEQERDGRVKCDATIRSNTWLPDREMTRYATGTKPIPKHEEIKEPDQPHLPVYGFHKHAQTQQEAASYALWRQRQANETAERLAVPNTDDAQQQQQPPTDLQVQQQKALQSQQNLAALAAQRANAAQSPTSADSSPTGTVFKHKCFRRDALDAELAQIQRKVSSAAASSGNHNASHQQQNQNQNQQQPQQQQQQQQQQSRPQKRSQQHLQLEVDSSNNNNNGYNNNAPAMRHSSSNSSSLNGSLSSSHIDANLPLSDPRVDQLTRRCDTLQQQYNELYSVQQRILYIFSRYMQAHPLRNTGASQNNNASIASQQHAQRSSSAQPLMQRVAPKQRRVVAQLHEVDSGDEEMSALLDDVRDAQHESTYDAADGVEPLPLPPPALPVRPVRQSAPKRARLMIEQQPASSNTNELLTLPVAMPPQQQQSFQDQQQQSQQQQMRLDDQAYMQHPDPFVNFDMSDADTSLQQMIHAMPSGADIMNRSTELPRHLNLRRDFSANAALQQQLQNQQRLLTIAHDNNDNNVRTGQKRGFAQLDNGGLVVDHSPLLSNANQLLDLIESTIGSDAPLNSNTQLVSSNGNNTALPVSKSRSQPQTRIHGVFEDIDAISPRSDSTKNSNPNSPNHASDVQQSMQQQSQPQQEMTLMPQRFDQSLTQRQPNQSPMFVSPLVQSRTSPLLLPINSIPSQSPTAQQQAGIIALPYSPLAQLDANSRSVTANLMNNDASRSLSLPPLVSPQFNFMPSSSASLGSASLGYSPGRASAMPLFYDGNQSPLPLPLLFASDETSRPVSSRPHNLSFGSEMSSQEMNQ